MSTDSFYRSSSRHAVQYSFWTGRGRFNRISFLAWNVLLTTLSIAGVWLMLMLFGIMGNAQLPILAEWHQHSQVAWYGIALWLLLMVYLSVLVHIRRLHDLNQSGWLGLMLIIPLLQSIFWLYLLLASGSKHANPYGAVPRAAVWEVVVAWASIGLLIGAVLLSLGLGPYSDSSWQQPEQLLQQVREPVTPYF